MATLRHEDLRPGDEVWNILKSEEELTANDVTFPYDRPQKQRVVELDGELILAHICEHDLGVQTPGPDGVDASLYCSTRLRRANGSDVLFSSKYEAIQAYQEKVETA